MLRSQKWVRRFLETTADRRVVLFSGLVGVALSFLLGALNEKLKSGGAFDLISLQFSFSLGKFEAVVASWGDERLPIFFRLMAWDYLYPAVYAVFLAGLVGRVVGQRREGRIAVESKLPLIPLAAALIDYLENTLHVLLVSGVMDQTTASVFAPSLFATLKWILIVLTLAILAGLGLKKRFSG